MQVHLRLGLKLKKIHHILRFSQSQWPKLCQVQHKKKVEAEKNGGMDGKAFYILMNNAEFNKTMENWRNRMDVKV